MIAAGIEYSNLPANLEKLQIFLHRIQFVLKHFSLEKARSYLNLLRPKLRPNIKRARKMIAAAAGRSRT